MPFGLKTTTLMKSRKQWTTPRHCAHCYQTVDASRDLASHCRPADLVPVPAVHTGHTLADRGQRMHLSPSSYRLPSLAPSPPLAVMNPDSPKIPLENLEPHFRYSASTTVSRSWREEQEAFHSLDTRPLPPGLDRVAHLPLVVGGNKGSHMVCTGRTGGLGGDEGDAAVAVAGAGADQKRNQE